MQSIHMSKLWVGASFAFKEGGIYYHVMGINSDFVEYVHIRTDVTYRSRIYDRYVWLG